MLKNLFRLKVKNAEIICNMLTSLFSYQQRNVKKSKKSMKITIFFTAKEIIFISSKRLEEFQ